jgi:hypothetical protein
MQYVAPTDAAATECPIQTRLGGTWSAIAGGRFLVAVGTSNYGKTFERGAEAGDAHWALIKHTHTYSNANPETKGSGGHDHTVSFKASKTGTGDWTGFEGNAGDKDAGSVTSTTTSAGGHTHNVPLPRLDDAGSTDNGTYRNLPPYLAVYMWRRTA